MENIVNFKGYFIRKNTYDRQIVNEVLKCYAWMQPDNEVVLDVGACFGAYSLLAAQQGAKTVVSYEPEINNYSLCLQNVRSYKNIIPCNSALVNDDKKEISFYLTKGINKGNFSTTAFRGRNKIKVKAENFDYILDKYKPSTIKMDCEGSEYFLIQKPLPVYVKKITLEIHLTKKEWRNDLSYKLIKLFENWKVVTKPKIGEKNWHTIGAWVRN
jgi:FkbM family methyltransferase